MFDEQKMPNTTKEILERIQELHDRLNSFEYPYDEYLGDLEPNKINHLEDLLDCDKELKHYLERKELLLDELKDSSLSKSQKRFTLKELGDADTIIALQTELISLKEEFSDILNAPIEHLLFESIHQDSIYGHPQNINDIVTEAEQKGYNELLSQMTVLNSVTLPENNSFTKSSDLSIDKPELVYSVKGFINENGHPVFSQIVALDKQEKEMSLDFELETMIVEHMQNEQESHMEVNCSMLEVMPTPELKTLAVNLCDYVANPHDTVLEKERPSMTDEEFSHIFETGSIKEILAAAEQKQKANQNQSKRQQPFAKTTQDGR